MKKIAIFMMMVVIAVVFAGCNKQENECYKEADILKAYVKGWMDPNDHIRIWKDGDRWYGRYAYRIYGLKDDRWFFSDYTWEIVEDDVVLVNVSAPCF